MNVTCPACGVVAEVQAAVDIERWSISVSGVDLSRCRELPENRQADPLRDGGWACPVLSDAVAKAIGGPR